MTLTELRYIVAVARERHFGRAAAACFVSQPTLSVAIKKLEEQLDVILFERYKHDVKITPIGTQIVEQAQQVLEQAEKIKTIANEAKDPLGGQLRLGVIYTIGPYLLPKLIPVLHKAAPNLKLYIEENFTENLAEQLKRGELDIVILSTPFHLAGTDSRHLYNEDFLVALPDKHPLARKKSVKVDDLFDETLLLLKKGNCFRDQVLEACASCMSKNLSREHIQETLESSSIETIRQMVAAGSGVTILPATSVYEGPNMKNRLHYLPFSKPVPQREVVMIWRKSWPRDKLLELVESSVARINLKGVS